jgi:hypothetical protein
MKAITFLFFLVMVQSHCDVHRPAICECLKTEIETSYKKDVPSQKRMKMLLRYDELDCDEVAPLGPP